MYAYVQIGKALRVSKSCGFACLSFEEVSLLALNMEGRIPAFTFKTAF